MELTVQESWAQMTISPSLSAEKPSPVPDPLGWRWRQGPALAWPPGAPGPACSYSPVSLGCSRPPRPGSRPTAAVAQPWLMCDWGEGWAWPGLARPGGTSLGPQTPVQHQGLKKPRWNKGQAAEKSGFGRKTPAQACSWWFLGIWDLATRAGGGAGHLAQPAPGVREPGAHTCPGLHVCQARGQAWSTSWAPPAPYPHLLQNPPRKSPTGRGHGCHSPHKPVHQPPPAGGPRCDLQHR